MNVFIHHRHFSNIDLMDISVGDRLRVTGIVGQYDRNPPYEDHYEIRLRDQSDIEVFGLTISVLRQLAFLGAVLLFATLAFIVILRSKLKQRTREMQEKETQFQTVVENAHDLVWMIDREGKLTFVNRRVEEVSGYTADDIIGQHYRSFVHPDSLAISEEVFGDVLDGKHRQFEKKILIKGGENRVMLVNESPLHDNGDIVGIVGFGNDITDQKQTENALKESENTFRGIYDNATDAIYIQNKDGHFLDVNSGAVKMYGYSREFFIGKTPEFLSAPGKNNMKKIAGYIEKAFKGEPQLIEFWGKRKNGEIFPKVVRLNKSQYFGQDVIVAFASDVSQQKKTEETVAAWSERYETVVSATGQVIYDWDLKSNSTQWSGSIEAVLGYSVVEFRRLEDSWVDFVHPDDKERVMGTIKEAFEGSKDFLKVEYRFRKNDGSYCYILDRASILRDSTGKAIRSLGSMPDSQ